MDFVKENSNTLLYKKISKIPLNQVHPNHSPPKGKSYAIISDDDNSIFTYCSKTYNPELNENIFKPFEQFLIDNKISYQTKPCIINNSKFYIDYAIKQKINSTSIKDLIPLISIWNSYDGTLRPQMNLGFYRLCCENKLFCASHTSPQTLQNKSNLIDIVKSFLVNMKECVNHFEILQNIKGKVSDIESISKTVRLSQKIKDTSLLRLKKEIKGNFTYTNELGQSVTALPYPQITIFMIYNAINYSIYNMNSKELPEVKLKKDKMVMNEIIKNFL